MAEATRTVTFGSAVGLHARPAATIAGAAAASGHRITLTNAAGKAADAASVLLLLTMGVGHGDDVTITVEGDNADAVADQFAELVSSELDTGDDAEG